MAKRPLKVFRTSIGFQDAYVAASSRKAALEAWGTAKDLFSAGLAEVVTDPKLTKVPLARPGEVIRTSRGTIAQHLAAAGKVAKPNKRQITTDEESQEEPAGPSPKPKKQAPLPSRGRLERAEAALNKKTQAFDSEMKAIDAKIGDLRKERDRVRSRRDSELGRLEDRRTVEEDAYRDALEALDGQRSV